MIELYAAGHKLEEIELSDSETKNNFSWVEFFKSKNAGLIGELKERAFYYEVFNPTEKKEKDPMQGWLVNDFSDIYRDLKIELEKLKVGTEEAIEDALWQMKFSFNTHWGDHCISALRSLHYMRKYEK